MQTVWQPSFISISVHMVLTKYEWMKHFKVLQPVAGLKRSIKTYYSWRPASVNSPSKENPHAMGAHICFCYFAQIPRDYHVISDECHTGHVFTVYSKTDQITEL